MIRFLYVTFFCLPILIVLFIVAVCGYLIGLGPKFVHRLARMWFHSILFFSGTKVAIEGMENLNPEKGYLILVNHQSAFDIPLVLAHLPVYFRFISKQSLFHIPVMGWGMHMIGYIPIDRENKAKSKLSLQKAAKGIENGHSILMFPEGTRSRNGKMNPFKFGFLKVAAESEQIEILPISILGTYDIMVKGSLKINKASTKMVIHPPYLYRQNEIGNDREKSAKVVKELERIIGEGLESQQLHEN